MSPKRCCAVGCAAAMPCLLATGSPGQRDPDKPIRLIVRFGAGGGSRGSRRK